MRRPPRWLRHKGEAPAVPARSDAIVALFFEPAFYSRHPGVPSDPSSALSHFLDEGMKRNLQPGRLFDPVWYLATYPDVQRGDLAAFGHYWAYGWREGRLPGPWILDTMPLDATPAAVHELVDAARALLPPIPPRTLTASEVRWYWVALGPQLRGSLDS